VTDDNAWVGNPCSGGLPGAEYASGFGTTPGQAVDEVAQVDLTDFTVTAWPVGVYPAGIALVLDEPVPPTVAGFTATPTRGRAPLTVQFTDSSTGRDLEYNWDFGDGTTSYDENPTHTYTVELTVYGPCGHDSATDSIKVKRSLPSGVVAGPPQLAIAYLLVSPEHVVPNQQVEISVNVGNSGQSEGSRGVSLYLNGVYEQSQMVTVGAGSAKQVVFRVTKAAPGVYEVNVEGKLGQFVVIAPQENKYLGGPLGTAGIIAIVVVAIILIGGVVYIVRSKES